MSIRTLFSSLVLLSFVQVNAQSVAQWTAWGDAAMVRGDHYGASRFYGEALAKEPGRMSLQWSQAEACRLSDQYDKAAELYEKVQRKDMGRQHPEALRWTAEMQLCTGNYADARSTWQKVLQKEKDKSSFAAQRAVHALRGCAMADSLNAHPADVTIEHLPEPVNSYASEFGARRDTSGALVFSSLRGELSDEGEVEDTAAYHVALFRAASEGSTWAGPQPYPTTAPLNEDRANTAWSSDGRYLYFTRCLAGSPCTIVAQELATGSITELQGLNDGSRNTQPMVAVVDGSERLFFASDRPGGVGGMDLWWGHLNGNTVRDLFPLLGAVNTPGDESTPFYEATEARLYFSSNFLPGLGGSDIFVSAHRDDVFEAPKNWGTPFNSPANDLYAAVYPAKHSGLLTSNRVGSLAKKGETCCSDIYLLTFPAPPQVYVPEDIVKADTVLTVQERLTDLRSKLPVRLYFHNDEPDPRSWNTGTAQRYDATYDAYKALLPAYRKANVSSTSTAALVNFFRDEVDKGRADLDAAIPVLRQALDEGQRIELVVRGFASPLAKSDYNKNLSLRRIQSVVNQLRAVDGGVFIPYLEDRAGNGGKLTITPAPFGEDRTAVGVSDDLGDLTNSVYAVAAAMERRIEIEQLLEAPAEGVTAQMDRTLIDLGPHMINDTATVRYFLYNRGSTPLKLLDITADCGCTTAKPGKSTLAPGESTALVVEFNGRAPEGPMQRNIVVLTDGVPQRIELRLIGTMHY